MFENHIIDKFNIVKPQKVITCKLLSYARNMLEVDLHFQKSDGHDSVVWLGHDCLWPDPYIP